MTKMQVFNYGENPVRMVDIAGEPWWVLADVCRVLEITNHKNVSARLDTDEKGVHLMDTLGGPQQMTIINESGLYAVILRSEKPEAKPFRRWVTHEVLPAIRRTGNYSINDSKPKRMPGLELLALRRTLQELDYKGSKIRVVQWNGQHWFSVADVARATGQRNPYCTARKLNRDEITLLEIGTTNNGLTQCVNHSGLASLLLRSNKPEAVSLLAWIMEQCSQTV